MKKLTLLLTIICAGQLFGMESYSAKTVSQGSPASKDRPEKPTYTYEETYGLLPQELKQEIINAALATNNSLPNAIKAIKAFSTLHGVNYNNTDLVNILMRKFFYKTQNEIIFAIEEPETYQKIAAILEASKDVSQTINILKQKNLLPDNLKDFTGFVHMLADKFNIEIGCITGYFKTPMAIVEKYRKLNNDLRNVIQYNPPSQSDFQKNEKVTQLLKDGADTNYTHPFGQTLLELAAENNRVIIVKLLLNEGANPHLKNSINIKLLPLAISKNSINMVKLLLDAGANPNFKTMDSHYTKRPPLFHALNTIFIPLNKKDVIDIETMEKAKQIIQLLLAYGAVRDQETIELFDIARDRFKESIHTLRLETKLNEIRQMLTRKNPAPVSKLIQAVKTQNTEEINNLLTNENININEQDNEGNTPLIIAVNNRDVKTVKYLLQLGADKNISNNNDQTAFDIAFENNDDALIDLLTEFDT